jgi:hypothetical protein
MSRPRSRQPSNSAASGAPAQADIDALYGLDPVFEPGRERHQELGTAAAFQSIQCPYCGERFETLVDTATGSATYIEDCQICCQPIEFELRVDSDGAFVGLGVRRS